MRISRRSWGFSRLRCRARKSSEEALLRGDTAGPPANGGNGHTGNGGNGGASAPAAPETTIQPGTTKAAAEAMTDEPPALPAKMQGLDLGPACGQCGGMMQRTGSLATRAAAAGITPAAGS